MEIKFPRDNDLEASVLCEILVDPQDSFEYLTALAPEDFFSTSHRRIFEAMQVLAGMAETIGVVELQSYLKSSGHLESVGGATYLGQLLDQPPPASAQLAISGLRALAVRRRTIEICHAGAKRAMTDPDATVTVDYMQIEAMKLNPDANTHSVCVPIRTLCTEGLARWEKAKEDPKSVRGVLSGVGKLDHVSCGFQKTDLVILAGRPSMGKTAMSIGWAMHAAKDGHPVLYFSLEQSSRQLIVRAVSGKSRVNSHLFKTGYMSDQQMGAVRSATGELSQMPIFVDDSGGLEVGEIRRRARRLARSEKIGIIFIDHLQLVGISGRAENRNIQLGMITRELKAMAKELLVPVVVLSQLNRGLESRTDKRPRLSDLRESGNIEQDSDIVAFIYRPAPYKEETDRPEGYTELILAKHRDGQTNTSILRFDPQTVSFDNAADELGGKVFYDGRKK